MTEKRQPIAKLEIDGTLSVYVGLGQNVFQSAEVFLNKEDVQSLKKDIEVYEHENECTKCRGL